MSDVALASIAAIKPKLSRDDRIMRGFIVMVGVWMVVAVLLPLYFMLSKSTENHDGDFIGLANFQEYFSTPA
ncbi:MAG: putative 2-aminoethylphosphonate ABC transporter permease subunit, partial [Rhodospirillaceae bacterium]|nr:putative 2-aminoethylphosphonate ABC transporter permease subunit [Rhodospirillaceae bacterium]